MELNVDDMVCILIGDFDDAYHVVRQISFLVLQRRGARLERRLRFRHAHYPGQSAKVLTEE